MKRPLIPLVFLAGVATAALAFYIRDELRMPAPLPPSRDGERGAVRPGEGLIVEIPRGLGARGIVDLLFEKKLIRNRYVTWGYLLYTRTYNKLQAGEYLFEQPATVPEIVRKIASGAVYLHKFTVPEGLTVKQIAQKWQEQGFGKSEDFLGAAAGASDLVKGLDERATSVEGYLFPETYSFPAHTTARQAVTSMLDRFRQTVARLQQTVPPSSWPRDLHDTTIVASLVETEAAQSAERPLIASVYLNRLSRNILLQCDPTVIYALDQANLYRGELTLADLRFKSPYNTYLYAGLPPGPITNPGYASLLAAVQPASTKYLFFVRTSEGRHAFSETLAAHTRAVAAYRKRARK